MKRFINLVPESHRRRVVLRRHVRRWSVGLLLTVVGLVLYVVWEREVMLVHQARRIASESTARPYLEMTQSIDRLTKEIKAIEQNDALLHRLTVEGSPLLPIAVVSRGTEQCGGRVWIERLKFTTSMGESKTPANGTVPVVAKPANSKENTGVPSQKLIVDGFAVDNIAVAEFVGALQQTKAFRSVELKSSIYQEVRGSTAWAFSIESEL